MNEHALCGKKASLSYKAIFILKYVYINAEYLRKETINY